MKRTPILFSISLLFSFVALFSLRSDETLPTGKSQINRKIAQESTDTSPIYGGENSMKWKTESIIANAIMEQYKIAASVPDLKDFAVAIPIQIHDSGFHPYGDGQSNAHMDIGKNWTHSTAPLVARLDSYSDGHQDLKIFFDKSLGVTDYEKVAIQWNGRNGWKIHPKNWKESFIVTFDAIQVLPVADLVKAIPETVSKFLDGRSVLDPEHIAAKAAAGAKPAYTTLLGTGMGQGFNSRPYQVTNIHGRFPQENGMVTAVGAGWTWVIERGNLAPFKNLYSCFSGRNETAEAESGAPSGSGWHLIGDPGETLLNILEPVSIPIAVGEKIPESLGSMAYQLNGIAISKPLKPGEAFVTSHGQYHWYAIPTEHEICVQIWVHNCEPSPDNGWGFVCK